MNLIQNIRSDALRSDAEGAFFWLESGDLEATRKSTVGTGQIVLKAVAGKETEFVEKARMLFAAAPQNQKFIILLSYEFGNALSRAGQKTVRWHKTPNETKTAFVIKVKSETVLTAEELKSLKKPSFPVQQSSERVFNFSIPKKEYIRKIETIKEQTKKGKLEVLCLTNEVLAVRSEMPDPLETFLKLRSSSLTNRTGFIEWADGAVLSASPERFLSKKGQTVSSSPIKGTRARGKTAAEDETLRNELVASTKDAAELTAVTAGIAAELAAVCVSGSVVTKSAGHIESFKQVHQMVATVAGELLDTADIFDVLQQIFPAASMVGTPKADAASLISELEENPRGWYSGCFGVVSKNGDDAELAMTIRSIEYSNEHIKVGAGGGITKDSDSNEEWEEMVLKADAMLNALDKNV